MYNNLLLCKFSCFNVFMNFKNLLILSKNPEMQQFHFSHIFFSLHRHKYVNHNFARDMIVWQIPRKRIKGYHETEILYENGNCLQQFAFICRVNQQVWTRNLINSPKRSISDWQAFRLRSRLRNDEMFVSK